MGNADGSPFGLDGYVQIRACGTYRCRSQPLTPFSHGRRVASHGVGMLLAVAPPIVGARSVDFFLVFVSTAEVIRVLRPPLLIGFTLLLAATVGPTTGLLSLVEPRVRMKPTTTERTSPPREHMLLLQRTSLGEANRGGREENRKSKRERLIETELKKGSKSVRKKTKNQNIGHSLIIGRLSAGQIRTD